MLFNRMNIEGRSAAASRTRAQTIRVASTSTSTSGVQKSGVLIVGGGPAGLATALMLKKRGWTDIKVLESRPSVDFEEPDKSFGACKQGSDRWYAQGGKVQ